MVEKLCVVMPVYNEEAAIGEVLCDWASTLDRLGIDYVIRPYNDGSKDRSLVVMNEVASKHPRIDVRNKSNGGHGNTILTGYREASADGFDWVFQIDSDGELGPDKFGELWSRRGEYDFLVGIRDGRKQQLSRKILSFVSRLCVRLFFGRSVWDVNTPYRLMRVSVFKGFYTDIPLTTFAPNVILSGLAARYGLRSYEQKVPQHDRTTGEVSIKKWKLLKAAIKSFSQTITFPFQGGNVVRGQPFSFVMSACIWSALALSFLFCMSIPRVAVGIVEVMFVGMLFYKLGMYKIVEFANWCERHSCALLLTILLIGLIERALTLLLFPQFLEINNLNCDFVFLWNTAKTAATGIWPVSKSWTTTALWSIIIGFTENMLVANVVSALIHAATALVGYLFARKWMSTLSALVCVFLFYCSPNVFTHGANVIATEHLFAFFVMATLYFASGIYYSPSKTAVHSVLSGICIWLATWSRGEGVVLWPTVAFFSTVTCCCCLKSIRNLIVSFSLLFCVFFIGTLLAFRINMSISDSKTIFCSNDNFWPRLHGATVSSGGTCANDNGPFIWHQYLADHPDCDWEMMEKRLSDGTIVKLDWPKKFYFNCPAEVVPYIKREISRRWKEMGFFKKLTFIVDKEIRDWCGDYLYALMISPQTSRYYIAQCTSYCFPGFLVVCGIGSCLVMLIGQKVNKFAYIPMLLIIPIFVMNVAVLAVTESGLRYGHLFHILWPFVVMMPFRRNII